MRLTANNLWSAVMLLREAVATRPDGAKRLADAALEMPDLAQLLKNLDRDPLLNYKPFDVEDDLLPNGDPKSSPLRFHLDRSKQRIIVTGNRCGKTHSGTAEVVSGCIGMDPVTKGPSTRFKPPLKVWAVSETEDTSIEIMQAKYRELIPDYLLSGDSEYRIGRGWKNNQIILRPPFSSLIQFRFASQGASTFQGTKQEIVHLDEEQPKDVDDECVARTAGVGGPPGEIIRTFTPIYRESVGISWIHASLYTRRHEIPDLAFHLWSLWDVPDSIIPREEKQRIEASYDEENRDTRIYGFFQPSGIRLGFAMDLIKAQRELHLRKPTLGYLDEIEEEVVDGTEPVRFSRSPVPPETVRSVRRVIFRELSDADIQRGIGSSELAAGARATVGA